MTVVYFDGDITLIQSFIQVKCLRLLPSPDCSALAEDHFASSRPLVAVCDSSASGAAFMSTTFISLKSGNQVSVALNYSNQ